MPTVRPRLTITLTPEVDRALTAFADATGQSKSNVILDALETMLPVMEKIAVMAQSLRRAKPEVLRQIQSRAESLETLVTGLSSATGHALDLFLGVGARASSERSEQEPRATAPVAVHMAQELAEPPPSNRGVRNSAQPSKVTPIRTPRRG